MPKVILTKEGRAKEKLRKLQAVCKVAKSEMKMSYKAIAEEMGMPEPTLIYRFKHGILTADEWIVLIEILEIEREDIEKILWRH